MTNRLTLHYFACTDIWNKFCELHYSLFQLTCDEYSTILSSNIELLEDILLKKDQVINEIASLEQVRYSLIQEIEAEFATSFDRASSLIDFFESKIPNEKSEKHLQKYNLLLIDLINQLKDQNKKNQAVLNKTIKSLAELREAAQGIKSFTVYNAKGTSQRVTSPSDRG